MNLRASSWPFPALTLRLDAVAGNTAPWRESFWIRSGTCLTTLSDNSRRDFVERRASIARVFTSFPRGPGDNMDANCRLGASFRGDEDLQVTTSQQLTRRPKNSPPQNAKNLEPQQLLSSEVGRPHDNSRPRTSVLIGSASRRRSCRSGTLPGWLPGRPARSARGRRTTRPAPTASSAGNGNW